MNVGGATFVCVMYRMRSRRLIGTGARFQFPEPALLAPLQKAGIGVEVMDTQAACRTYNILLGEGRSVAAALIL